MNKQKQTVDLPGAMNSGVPITDLANDLFLSVAKPKSPILTDPVGPVMKMLSHFKSLWIKKSQLLFVYIF